jgi:hypothetical protein
MGNKQRIGPLECATVQAILIHKKITKIKPPELAKLLGIKPTRAGMIMKRLGWQNKKIPKIGAEWHKNGSEKDFPHCNRPAIIKTAKRLGVDLEN